MNKVLVISYDVNPYMGSEATKAHFWILALAEYFDVDVFVHRKHSEDIEKYPYPFNIKFIFIDAESPKEKSLKKSWRFDKINRLFIETIENDFIQRMSSGYYRFAHFLSPSGIHSYNSLFKKADFNYVIGPLGGGISTPSGFERLFPLKEKIKNKMREFFYNRLKKNPDYIEYIQNASRIIIGTEYLYRYLPKNVHEKTMIQFDTLIDMAEFSKAETSSGEKKLKNCIKIVFSGRLTPIKGIEMLVEAIRIIKKELPQLTDKIKLDIYGDGPLSISISKMISRNGLGDVINLHGRVPRKTVIEALSKADIFCLPTIRENGGQAILEAMGAGLPVITSDYGGPKYSVTSDCGIKLPVDNYNNYVRNLADAIVKLSQNEFLRISMGEAARKRVCEEFSLVTLKKRIPRIYEGIKRLD